MNNIVLLQGKGDKAACWGNRCRDSPMYLRKKIYLYENERNSFEIFA